MASRRSGRGKVETAAPKPAPELRASVRQCISFSAHVWGGPSLSLRSSCGEFLDALRAVVEAGPGYLIQEDAARMRWLLAALKAFSWRDYGGGELRVQDLPISRMEYGLRKWVLAGDPDPLTVTFRLNAAEFIEAHMFGHTVYRENEPPWELRPLAAELADGRQLRLLAESSFRREVTMRYVGGTVVEVRPPQEARLMIRDVEVPIPEKALFAVQRCHLSMGTMDFDHFRVSELAPVPFDINEGFSFRGALALEHPGKGLIALEGSIPIRWITRFSAERPPYEWLLRGTTEWPQPLEPLVAPWRAKSDESGS